MNIPLPELPFDLTSFSGKNLLITVAVIYTVGLSAFLIFNTVRIVAPITSYNDTSIVNMSDTGTQTSCDTNEDCWCKSFDGAKFLPGKTPSVCDSASHTCAVCHYR